MVCGFVIYKWRLLGKPLLTGLIELVCDADICEMVKYVPWNKVMKLYVLDRLVVKTKWHKGRRIDDGHVKNMACIETEWHERENNG